MKVRVGTRGSPLALIQTQLVADALGCVFEMVIVKTEGDRNRHDPLAVLGGRGVFVRDIEERLLAGEIDAAVHSLKDLPAERPSDLWLAAIPERADARDVLVARHGLALAQLPARARVGSSSQRRTAQLLALRPDVQVVDIRGNVDTRLHKLDEGQYDAIVLAAAGLARMGLAGRITHVFTPEEMLPSPGQGALAVECRANDLNARELFAPLDHAQTRAAVMAERSFLQGLGGGCQLPIGAFATVQGQRLELQGMIARGQRIERNTIEGPLAEAEALGMALAARLLAGSGAAYA
jgi:hydroxymethylbilane synthase